MDTALLGVICGFVGTVMGALVAYFGPLQAEQRRGRNEHEARAEDRITADIGRYVAARTVTDQWLDLLRRAYEAAMEGRLDLDQFDADVVRHSDELRLRLADLAHLGITAPTTDDMFRTFRTTTGQIRRFAVDGDDDRIYSDDVRGTASFRSVMACGEARARWAMRVLDELSLRTGRDFSAP